jgi:hypothetical protein
MSVGLDEVPKRWSHAKLKKLVVILRIAITVLVTLSLPDDLYQRASHFADLLGKDVLEVLTDTLTLSLAPIATQSEVMPAVATLSDQDVLALSQSQLHPQADERLSALLEKQQEGLLTTDEQSELLGLMQIYRKFGSKTPSF